VGLVESEKTMTSAVTLDLANVRIETALRLALKQLDLTFRVHPDGLLLISSTTSQDWDGDGAEAMILDKLNALQKQVAELKSLVAPPAAAMPALPPAKK